MQALTPMPPLVCAGATRQETTLQLLHYSLQLEATRVLMCAHITSLLVEPAVGQDDEVRSFAHFSKSVLRQILASTNGLPPGKHLAQIPQSHKPDASQSRRQMTVPPSQEQVDVDDERTNDYHHPYHPGAFAFVDRAPCIVPQRGCNDGLPHDARGQALVPEIASPRGHSSKRRNLQREDRHPGKAANDEEGGRCNEQGPTTAAYEDARSEEHCEAEGSCVCSPENPEEEANG
mmetsp:Transcript_70570/g.163091  ORF Transcript_70570/g.163091 Transcript_70570/m.163091 type:complete len:233 (+) Transcript_70570:1066-1764(+)